MGIKIPPKSRRGALAEGEANEDNNPDINTEANEISILHAPISSSSRQNNGSSSDTPYAMEIEVGDFKVRINNGTDSKLLADMLGVLRNMSQK